MNKKLLYVTLVLLLQLCGRYGLADKTWDGDTDTNFENGANWSGDSPPANDTTTDLAVFSGTPANHPRLTANRSVKGFSFPAGTWTPFATGTPYTLQIGTAGIVNSGTCYTTIGTNAILSISGPTDLKLSAGASSAGYMVINARITGSGSLDCEGTIKNGWQTHIHLRGNNDFTGGITFHDGTYVHYAHPNAFGSQPNMVVRVLDSSGPQSSYGAQLYLDNAAGTFSSNITEIVVEGELAQRGQFYQARGTTVSTKITLEGGVYSLNNSDGTGDRYNNGEIVLKTGTQCLFDKTEGYGTYSWYQTGIIRGGGSLRIYGYNSYDETPHFNGSNTYAGGTVAENKGNEQMTYVGHNFGFGTGPIQLDSDTDTRVSFTITANLTMPNTFRGRGKVGTGSFLLTTTGGIAPQDTGLSTVTKNVGTLYFEDLKFGSDTQGATYEWQYDDSGEDLVACDTLQLGAAGSTVNVEWLGTNDLPRVSVLGTNYVLFSYSSGPDPTIGTPWEVTAPSPLHGEVSVDAPNNRVLLTLYPPPMGTIVIFR